MCFVVLDAGAHVDGGAMPPTRLASGLSPPTNRWFSRIVFGDTPQPVFPLRLAFTLGTNGFGFGLPQVVTSSTGIMGSHQEDISVRNDTVAHQIVSAYDDASFTVKSVNAQGREIGRTV